MKINPQLPGRRIESRLGLWILVSGMVVYALIRGALLLHPGYIDDVLQYKTWAVQAARFGPARIYQTSGMDYPPLYAYILAPLGKIYLFLTPGAMEEPTDSTLLTVLVKLPPLFFDLGIAWLLFRWTRQNGSAQRVAWIVAGAYLFNPAVLVNNAYWGAPDSIHSFFILAAFLTFGSEMGVGSRSHAAFLPAWIFVTLASLMKPLGAPFFPLLLALTILVYGFGPAIAGIAVAAVTVLIICAPFLIQGQGVELFRRVTGDVAGAMPFTSANAHNLWWVLGPWRDAEVPWLGPFSATHISIMLFGATYAALVWKAYSLYRAQAKVLWPAQIIALAGMVSFSFFIFSTHLHENHMFAFIPLLAALTLREPVWRWLFIAGSFGVLANLLLHDIFLSQQWPFTIGPHSRLQNLQLGRAFHVPELVAIWISTVFNLGLYVVAMTGIFRRKTNRGWLERLGGETLRAESSSESISRARPLPDPAI